MNRNKNIKYSFDPAFQGEILKYVLIDKEGLLVIKRVKPSYFTLIEHGLIYESILKFFKKEKRVPSKNTLKEEVRVLINSKKYVDLVTKEDIVNINSQIDYLFSTPLQDADYLKEKIYQFSTYVEMKQLNEIFDLTDFTQYETYSRKVEEILQKSKPKEDDEPLYLIKDVVTRQFIRQADPDVLPSPFKQLNNLTNAGGFPRHTVMVLLDKPKAKKTFFLINLARGYLRMKRSVLYIDTENGKGQIMDRVIQSSINKTKKELYSGEFDKQESQHIRKLSRFGVEMVVDRVPALVTDCRYIREEVLKLRSQGIDIRVLIIDYAAKLAAISGEKDDFERVSRVYVDIQDLAEELDLDCIWTAHHITREGAKHSTTRYEETDIAQAISIIRNAQAVYGLNATPEEISDNIQRLEIVVQRDGVPKGRALFHVDVERQRAIEFTKEQRARYDELYGSKLDEAMSNSSSKKPKPKVDPSKHGDI